MFFCFFGHGEALGLGFRVCCLGGFVLLDAGSVGIRQPGICLLLMIFCSVSGSFGFCEVCGVRVLHVSWKGSAKVREWLGVQGLRFPLAST